MSVADQTFREGVLWFIAMAGITNFLRSISAHLIADQLKRIADALEKERK